MFKQEERCGTYLRRLRLKTKEKQGLSVIRYRIEVRVLLDGLVRKAVGLVWWGIWDRRYWRECGDVMFHWEIRGCSGIRRCELG